MTNILCCHYCKELSIVYCSVCIGEEYNEIIPVCALHTNEPIGVERWLTTEEVIDCLRDQVYYYYNQVLKRIHEEG